MPPKAKKAPRKKNHISESNQTQPRLNFEPPVKDPLEHRKKLLSKIEGIRTSMMKLEQEEEKYLRQFLKNQMRIKENEPNNSTEEKIELEGQKYIRYTLEFPQKADVLEVILGQYSIYQDELFKQEVDSSTSPETNQSKQTEQHEVQQRIWMKPEFLKEFQPGFIRTLSKISIEEEREPN